MRFRIGELFKFWSIKGIAYIGVLSALALVSTRFASFYMIPGILRVDPAGPAVIMIAGMLFGPIAGMLVGGLSDILGFFIYNPTTLPWNPFVFAGQITYGLVAGLIFWTKLFDIFGPAFQKFYNFFICFIVSTFRNFISIFKKNINKKKLHLKQQYDSSLVWKITTIVTTVTIAQLCGFLIITLGLTFIMPNSPTFWGLFLTRVPFQPLFIIWYSILSMTVVKIFDQRI